MATSKRSVGGLVMKRPGTTSLSWVGEAETAACSLILARSLVEGIRAS